MDNISSFLERFKNLLSSKVSLVLETTEAIKKHIGADIEKSQVRIQGGVVFVQAAPTVKNTIFIKKSAILATIKERTGANITDIR